MHHQARELISGPSSEWRPIAGAELGELPLGLVDRRLEGAAGRRSNAPGFCSRPPAPPASSGAQSATEQEVAMDTESPERRRVTAEGVVDDSVGSKRASRSGRAEKAGGRGGGARPRRGRRRLMLQVVERDVLEHDSRWLTGIWVIEQAGRRLGRARPAACAAGRPRQGRGSGPWPTGIGRVRRCA